MGFIVFYQLQYSKFSPWEEAFLTLLQKIKRIKAYSTLEKQHYRDPIEQIIRRQKVKRPS